MNTEKTTLLPDDIRHAIDHWVAKYPPEHKQSAVLEALKIVQDHHHGWLSDELIKAVADYLAMPVIAVYEVATFYSMYDLQPVGRHKINVCNSISCMLNGSEKIIDHLCQRLGVEVGETTADGKFTIKEVECLAACAGAPACTIGRQYYENLTVEQIDKLVTELEAQSHG